MAKVQAIATTMGVKNTFKSNPVTKEVAKKVVNPVKKVETKGAEALASQNIAMVNMNKNTAKAPKQAAKVAAIH